MKSKFKQNFLFLRFKKIIVLHVKVQIIKNSESLSPFYFTLLYFIAKRMFRIYVRNRACKIVVILGCVELHDPLKTFKPWVFVTPIKVNQKKQDFRHHHLFVLLKFRTRGS